MKMRDFSIDDFATAMLRSDCTLAGAGEYVNANLRQGHFSRVHSGGKSFWFSVSNADHTLAPDEVATAITHRNREICRQGYYYNKKGARGFEATVRSGDHCFMLGAHDI